MRPSSPRWAWSSWPRRAARPFIRGRGTARSGSRRPQDRPGPAEASVRLEVPGGYGHTATHMRVEADVVVRRSAATDIARQQHAANTPLGLPPHWRVAPQQLGGLIDAMLPTLTGKSPPRWPA